MLDCFSSSFPQSPLQHKGNQCLTSQDYSAGTTPRSNALSSPNVNLSTEFNKLIHTPSFKDIQSKIHAVEEWENGDVNGFVATVIEPNPEDVQKILDHATSNPFTQHLSTYFNHTEQICHLLLNLEQWIHHTRCRYIPINSLVKDLKGDPDSLTQEQARSTYTLHNELQTIDRLGYQLQTDVESDRSFIGVCTGRGRESYLIWQVVKRLARSYEKIGFLLGELEQYICRFFKVINNERSFLLREIHQVHQGL